MYIKSYIIGGRVQGGENEVSKAKNRFRITKGTVIKHKLSRVILKYLSSPLCFHCCRIKIFRMSFRPEKFQIKLIFTKKEKK